MSTTRRDEFLIIAGTNKAGTTALFRYLGDHPAVSVSRYKESRFFYKDFSQTPLEAISQYRQQFLNNQRGASLFVEASPTYLHGGREVARRIKGLIPEAKLLFSLRDPSARVISYYLSSFGQPQVATYGIGFEEFVERAVEAAGKQEADLDTMTLTDRAFRQELTMSQYARFLREFLDEFRVENVRIHFFDSLTTNIRGLMRDICLFAGVDPGFYDEYEFRVENQTRLHRHEGLRSLAGRANYALEPFLNRFPSLRRAARRVYDAVNVDKGANIPIPQSAVNALDQFFQPANAELAELMGSCYPDQPLPKWLTR